MGRALKAVVAERKPGALGGVLFASAEIFPLAKTGGLADVCAALPVALTRLGANLRLLMPGYESALDTLVDARVEADLGEILGAAPIRLISGRMPDSGLAVWLLDCPALYRRPGSLYQDASGRDWPDNAWRFGVFCHAVARLALGAAPGGWRPSVVHCHDWHTGLVPYLLQRGGREGGALARQRPRSMLTVHNAAFQGNFPLDTAARLELPPEILTPDAIEFFGQLSFLKAGIRYADLITTVSPSYAREIRTPEFGCGLEGLFEARAADLVGILNGIDTDLWNPATDRSIAARYTSDDPAGKVACKADLQAQAGLKVDADAPLVAFASRLTPQKMADVALEQLPQLLARHPRLQFTLLGRGERRIEERFEQLAPHFPGRVAVTIGYDEAAAHRLHAGADILLHGSRFEPCGLAQMYAMRYGTVPVVRRVGGLGDTVVEAGGELRDSATKAIGSGFVFDEASGEAMGSALERCLSTYRQGARAWQELRAHGMGADFGWQRPAESYLESYATRLAAA
jgi:starch synthase